MGLRVPTFTDYGGDCNILPQTFFQMLANSVVSNVDDEGHTHCYLNLLYDGAYCDDLGTCFDCDLQGQDAETFLVNHLFALDECGHLGMKVLLNYGAGNPQ